MANISIKVKNEAKISLAWKKIPGEMAKAIANTIQKSGVFATGKVKEIIASGEGMWKAPLDTGAMRRGIHPIFGTNKVTIKPAQYTPYAAFVHEGTGSMRARPFFSITAERSSKDIQEFALKYINQALQTLNI